MTRAPLSTVKSRLYRGLAALKPEIERLHNSRTPVEAPDELRIRSTVPAERLEQSLASALRSAASASRRRRTPESSTAPTASSASAPKSCRQKRSRDRSLMVPLIICSVLLILSGLAVWTGLYQYQAVEAAEAVDRRSPPRTTTTFSWSCSGLSLSLLRF